MKKHILYFVGFFITGLLLTPEAVVGKAPIDIFGLFIFSIPGYILFYCVYKLWCRFWKFLTDPHGASFMTILGRYY